MTTETLERLKRAAAAKPNGNASNVRAADLSALIASHAALVESLGLLVIAGESLADECADEKRCEAWDEQRDAVNLLLRSNAGDEPMRST
jgi:hypothetical protein